MHGEKLTATRLGDVDAARDVLIVGSIHGDEDEGHEVVRAIRRRARGLSGATIWLVRSVNPDGVSSNRRTNARGVDLNRNFSVGWQRSGTGPTYSGP